MSQITNTSWLAFIFRLPMFLAVWAIAMAVKASVALLGFVMLAIMYRWRDVDFNDVPKVFTPWKNPEDWTGCPKAYKESQPKWWVNRMGGTSFWSFYKYHAIRNPANGLRNFPFFSIPYETAPKYRYICSEYKKDWGTWYWKHRQPEPKRRTWWYVVWYKGQLGVNFNHIWNDERYFVAKFGWRITPTDTVDGLPENSVRRQVGSGFASKFLPYREYN